MSERRIGTVIWFKTANALKPTMDTFEPYDFERAKFALYQSWKEGVFIFCAFERGELERLRKDFAAFRDSNAPDGGSYKCYAPEREIRGMDLSGSIMQPTELNLRFGEVAHID